MATNQNLAHEKISKLLFSLAIPSIIAQLVNILYNIVDRSFYNNSHRNDSFFCHSSFAYFRRYL